MKCKSVKVCVRACVRAWVIEQAAAAAPAYLYLKKEKRMIIDSFNKTISRVTSLTSHTYQSAVATFFLWYTAVVHHVYVQHTYVYALCTDMFVVLLYTISQNSKRSYSFLVCHVDIFVSFLLFYRELHMRVCVCHTGNVTRIVN